MARPPAKQLTQRELEVMHVFWDAGGEATVAEARDRLAASGRKLAHTTVATLLRILSDKGFLRQTNSERPFQYRPLRSFEDVSRNMVDDLIQRVFHGSREQFFLRLLEECDSTGPRKMSSRSRSTCPNRNKEKRGRLPPFNADFRRPKCDDIFP